MTLYIGTNNLQYLDPSVNFEKFHQKYNECQYHVFAENLKDGTKITINTIDKTFGVTGR